MFTHYNDTKDTAKCRNWGGWVVRGHPSPKVTSRIIIRKTAYNFLFMLDYENYIVQKH